MIKFTRGTIRPKRILSIALSAAIAVSSLSITPAKADSIQKKSFAYPHIVDKVTDIKSDYYYSDSYFNQSSYTYNPSLATMSLCMASAAAGSNVGAKTGADRIYTGYTKNIKAMLTENGFKNIYFNEDYTKKPTKDSVGFSFATKQIKSNNKNYTLLVINFENGSYEREWASNFKLGTEEFHQGFKEAGDRTINELNNYIVDKKITGDVKIWMAGYSRCGAVANYVASQLDSNFYSENITLYPKDIFVYTFAAPGITTGANYAKSSFKNIFNIISPYDAVPKLPPQQWGWHRFGQDIYLPSSLNNKDFKAKASRAQAFLDLMVKSTPVVTEIIPGYKLEFTETASINIVPDGNKKVVDIFDDIITALSVTIASNDNFQALNPTIDKTVDIFFGATDLQKALFLDSIKTQFAASDPIQLLSDTMGSGYDATDMVLSALDAAQIEIENRDELRESVRQTLYYAIFAALSDFENVPSGVISVANGIDSIMYNHLNFTYLAWLQSMDPNYVLTSDIANKTGSTVKKPGKVKIKKAKSKSKAKISVKIKKISKAKGYQIAVYSTKKNAKKNKKAIIKKVIKNNKTSLTISSKKFKKYKKLYVKVRAYVLDKKAKKYGKWSTVKKVK